MTALCPCLELPLGGIRQCNAELASVTMCRLLIPYREINYFYAYGFHGLVLVSATGRASGSCFIRRT